MAHQHNDHETNAVFYPHYIAIIRHLDKDGDMATAHFAFTKNIPVCPQCLCDEFERILKYHLVNIYVDHITSQPKIPTKAEALNQAIKYRDYLNSLSLAETLTISYQDGRLTIVGQDDKYCVQPICSVDFPQKPKAIYGDDFESFFANIFRDTYPHIEVTDEVLKQAIQEISKTHKDEPVERVMDLIEQYILSNNLQEDIQE